jgi:hypothetical protein
LVRAIHLPIFLCLKSAIRDVSDWYRSLLNVKFSTRFTLTLLFYPFWFVVTDAQSVSKTLIISRVYINSVTWLGEYFGRLVVILPHSSLICDLVKTYSFTVHFVRTKLKRKLFHSRRKPSSTIKLIIFARMWAITTYVRIVEF